MAGRLGGLRIGTAGFSGVSGHWAGAGVFPPGAKGKSDAQLDFFQEAFDVCEVNGTCHGMPSEAQIAGWRVRCAPRFELALKVHHAVTHPQPGAAPAHAVDTFLTFLRRAAGLGPHLRPGAAASARAALAALLLLLVGLSSWYFTPLYLGWPLHPDDVSRRTRHLDFAPQ
jgi:hypothetical protein